MAESPLDRPTSDARAEQALRTTLSTLKAAGSRDHELNADIARHARHDDLNRFGDEDLTSYGLDHVARDRLIAHARQDASLAALNASAAMNRAAAS